ncbi:hypothetical protein BKCO1_1000354 [Neofusicoccum parvum]|uniref:DlpA domain-containing protein n=1 Tax=Botryosphaeria parva (strain UCR-NP2) TaxID=1287680 RepID=R1EVG9_BOTPV|nr:hypothetical protein UCRNP2_1629 [Neofusicoccum parvum UCRNP2]GME66184.1 hypothetical protein BKCO1_1000354 [Neofusicoccum parvum]
MFATLRRLSPFTMSSAKLDLLAKYTACDISDALLKLDVPGAGFIPDIGSTVHFAPKTTSSFPNPIGSNPELKEPADKDASKIAPGTPYADLVNPSTIVVLSQPEGQSCAVVGGINGVRMEQLGAKGVLVSGRVRDLETLKGLKIPGDIIMLDPDENSAVVIPKDKVDAVLELVPKLTEADEKCMADVLAGGTVKEAFAKHRGQ